MLPSLIPNVRAPLSPGLETGDEFHDLIVAWVFLPPGRVPTA